MKAKGLTQYEKFAINKRLDNMFNKATAKDIADGKDWYKIANDEAQKLANEFNICPLKCAGVISALSPNNKWNQNLKDAHKVCKAFTEGKGANDVKVCTFNTNKFKAFAILKNLVEITNDSRKTYSFIRNVGSLDADRVTIDVWHLRACYGKDKSTPSPLVYDQLEALTLRKAKKLGLKGYEYQAIIWVVIRNNYNNN
jgi:hypothetical protein